MAPGFALEGDDLGVMHQAVDERDHAGGIGEHLGPLGEGLVGGDEGALFFMAAADELEQQIGVTIRVGEVADLVDNKQ